MLKAGHHSTTLHLAATRRSAAFCFGPARGWTDAKDKYGATPLMLAQRHQTDNAALIELLSGRGPAQLPGTVCDHCGKTAEQASVNTLKACGGCQAARFCGAACIAAAWPGHKKACKARAKERAKERAAAKKAAAAAAPAVAAGEQYY